MNKVTQNLPIVALVGRPNVGKSSIFNRFTRSRDALVDDTPGLTRDRQYGRVSWSNRAFHVVDTGGFEPKSNEIIPNLMREQTMVAVEEADVVIFVADAKSGPLPDDWSIADMLRRSGKPVICAVNKTEGKGGIESSYEFYGLGLTPVIPIAAAHGRGMEEIRSAVLELLPIVDDIQADDNFDKNSREDDFPTIEELAKEIHDEEEAEFQRLEALENSDLQDQDEAEVGEIEADEVEEDNVEIDEVGPVAVAVVGCPNAGKSSLINALLGENRLVASQVAGTTRDSIDLPFTDGRGHQFVLIDTAGIRRKSRIALRIEKFSVMAALKAIDRAEVAVLVLDAEREDISDQDRRVATLATSAGCGLVIVVNKWDLVSGGRKAQKEYLLRVQDAFPLFPHAPVLFISAKRGKGISSLLDTVHRVHRIGRQRISTGKLNRWLSSAVEKHPPPRRAGRAIKIRYMTQIATEPPTLLIFANRPDQVHETYRRYLEKQLREHFDFAGVPIRMMFRKGGNPFEKND
ncbi:MAG: ribosome biogenesis GTPase Der [Magnetococcales bacterium]|nr:ribosome biogenesis GTPase Der [Magnetococcales bacterium]